MAVCVVHVHLERHLPWRAAVRQRGDDIEFGALDVHLEQVDLPVPKLRAVAVV